MKKILMAMALLATSSGAFAQKISFQTHTPGCKFYPIMHAVSVSLLNSTACDLGSATQTIVWAPPTIWTTLPAFNAGVGWPYESTTVPTASWGTVTDFVWTDVEFQYTCPDGCSGTGALSTTSIDAPGTCPGTSVLPLGTTYDGLCGPHYATWTETGSGYMDDVTIDFY